MNNKHYMIPIVIIGNLVAFSTLCFTLYCFVTKPPFLADIVPDPNGAVLALLLTGFTLLILANRPWGRIIQKDTMPREKRIAYQDERNIVIDQRSSNIAFLFLSTTIVYAIAILSLCGYLDGICFLVFEGLAFVSLLIKYGAKYYYAKYL